MPENVSKTNLVSTAVSSLFSNQSVGDKVGSIFVAVCLTFFAFSTIISWNMFGKVNFEYLFKGKCKIVYSIICLAFIVLGSFLKNDLVWELTDFFNYLMVIPNVLALLMLSKVVVNELKENGKKNFKDTPNTSIK